MTVGDPDSGVQVRDIERQIRINRPGEGPITISVVNGKRLLKLHSEKFVLVAETIELER